MKREKLGELDDEAIIPYTWNVSWTLGSPDVVKVTDDVIVFATIMSGFVSV